MLQTPINVEPSNGQLRYKGTNDYIEKRFTFQGDLLTFVQGVVDDMEYNPNSIGTTPSGFHILYNSPADGHMSAMHNGETFISYDPEHWMGNLMTAGHNYKHKFRLFQHYPQGMTIGGNSVAGEPMADMYYARGNIYQKGVSAYSNQKAYKPGDVASNSGYTYACNTEITKNEEDDYNSDGSSFNADHWTRVYDYQTVIQPNLDNIKEPFYYEWDDDSQVHHKILLGAIYMEVQYERHMVAAYDKTTGIVSFQKVTFVNRTIGEDEQAYTVREVNSIANDSLNTSSKFRLMYQNPYKMYVNYLETGWYDFKYRTRPVSTTEIKNTASNTESSDDSADDIRGAKNGIACDGTYSQAEAVGLKWYQYNLYAIDADLYSSSKTYRIGDLCIYTNSVYRCIVNILSGENFNQSHWQEVQTSEYGELVESTDRIFSYDLNANFPAHPFTFSYVAELTVCTQDDDTKTVKAVKARYTDRDRYTLITSWEEGSNPNELGWYEYNSSTNSFVLTTDTTVHSGKAYYWKQDAEIRNVEINNKPCNLNDMTASVSITDSIIKLKWYCSTNYCYNIFRREVYPDGTVAKNATYIGRRDSSSATHAQSSYQTHTIYDYTAANNKSYRYEIVVKNAYVNALTVGQPYYVDYIYNVNTKWDGWNIISITPKYDEDARHYYAHGDNWTFISAIDSGDITRNINSVLHVGTASYASTSRNHNKYESGSFIANLLGLICPDNEIVDDINRVKAWMDFISGDNPFILKSDKGDVWMVNIVNSPSRSYDETIEPILTKIRYEWAEIQDVEKCIIT